MLYPVGGLLELSYLSDDVGDLRNNNVNFFVASFITAVCLSVCLWVYLHVLMSERAYHPHFGEVDETLLGEVGRSLLDEGQVR